MATTTATAAPPLADILDDPFTGAFRGRLVAPDDPGYEKARRVYNAMIDRRPAAVAYCEDVADVIAGVEVARRHDLLLSVRGGGHNAGGLGVADGALCLDLSAMDGVHVDPAEGTVRVEGGATWGHVDHATHPFGLAVPSGIISTTGVGGLALGGGIGHLSRRGGLTVDNLLEAEVVLADGRCVTASADEHPDLFWALRGGGGNFGVVTSFLFGGLPVDTVVAGPTFWPIEQAAEVMRFYDRFIAEAPDELNGFFAFLAVPPAEPFPAELHGRTVCAVIWCWSGAAAEADRVFAPVRAYGPPIVDGIQPMPYPALNSAFDAVYPPGLQWYWKADIVDELTDAAIAEHVAHGSRLPSPQSTMHLYPIDGAAGRVPRDATAFAQRGARYSLVIVGVDPDPANAPTVTQWTRDYFAAVHRHGRAGAYVNFLMHDEGGARVQATYGPNHGRLREVKRRYDPENRFRVNQNIEP
jgi:FAD/FMN-containing dehydrogenase